VNPNPLTKIPAINIPGLRCQVCEVTPILAAEWLKLNRKNRKLKDPTLEAYARDMKNGDWYLTHQGIAFDAEGSLIDGQHRLQGVVRAKRNVLMFVSAGWPANGKHKTMDAVDRGTNRSLADQLHLQHGLPSNEAQRVVQITNSIASAFAGGNRVRKSSTACVLAVFELYEKEIKYVLGIPNKTHGLKSSTVLACVALAYGVWPDKTDDFYQRLRTGENLTRDNPVLHLRNYLLGEGGHADTQTLRCAILYHLVAFVEDRKLNSTVVNSNTALLQIIKLQGPRAEKIRKLYGAEAASIAPPTGRPPAGVNGRGGDDEPLARKLNISAIGEDAIRIGGTLSATFSSTDLSVRLDSPNLVGLWLADWRRRGWIESAGVREFRKTEIFGKV
jgi:hypothetical protein